MTDTSPYDQASETGDVGDVDVSFLDDVATTPAVGDMVRVVYRDPYAGVPTEVVKFGTVVEVVELASGPAVRVGWLPDVSDPLPLDPDLHGDRIDAPRVEVVGLIGEVDLPLTRA